MSQKIVQYIEIDIDYCSLTYGIAPCQASLTNSPPTGTIKCFNTLVTCQDRANFTNAPVTLRFAVPTSYLPQNIECIPDIKTIQFDPAVISLGQNLGQRATLTVSFSDHRHSDTGAGFDKYLNDSPSSRPYNPYTQGTFWGKFRARQPFLRGRPLRWITGNIDQALADMETRHYIIDSFSGPDNNGVFKIIAKDILKLADGDRALAPSVSLGYLVSDITSSATSLTLSPTGIGDSEYPSTGYVAIGGSEIVEFNRDPNTSLLLNFEGADGSTTFTDEARFKTINPAGNVQIDTAQFKFGFSSALFDGTGDSLAADGAADLAFGTGDWTIELFIRLNTTGTQKILLDFRPAAGNGLYPTLFVSSGNVLIYFNNSANRITGTTALTTGVWYHVAVARSGTSTKLFLNGTQEGSTYVDSSNYLVGANRPAIGIDGNNGTGTPHNGWMDNLRIKKGEAVYTANFTAPTSAVGLTASGDVLAINRGQLNTTASSHSAQDRAQLCLIYEAQSPDIIIADLLQTYAAVDPSYIDTAAWASEIAAHLNRLYSATIAQPTSVNELVSELIEQAGLSMWWNDRDQEIGLLVLRGLIYTNALFSEDNIMLDTLQISEQPDKRLSQVHTYFGQINPLTSLTDKSNFRSSSIVSDLQSETDYGSAAIKEIFSRWIPALGRTIADRLGDILIGRFKDAPRKISFSTLRNSMSEIILANGYQVESWPLQDETGADDTVNVQVTRLRPSADLIEVETEEVLFTAAAEDLTNRRIIVDASIHNVNLRSVHDSLYPAPESGITVICTINSGVLVGSTSTSTYAFETGSWPAGVTLILHIAGKIMGKGGKGADGSGGAAGNGGNALSVTAPLNLSMTGQLWAGGGGGGSHTFPNPQVGGGGGAGYDGGAGGDSLNSTPATAGTDTAGGTGAVYIPTGGWVGGAGGGPALAGSAAPGGGAAVGPGSAGLSVVGISNVTQGSWDGTTFTPGSLGGDLRGAMSG